MSKNATVALAKESTIQESVTRVFDLLGGVTNMIENCTQKHLKQYPDALWINGCPPAESCLYMTISNRWLVDGANGQLDEYCRPRMAADQPVWRIFVEERAREFYKDSFDG
ncbi:MAG: hypothetical protein LUF32_08705 [Clostridiales bacterium]|nr:hypothetical protein [Clostridiales bacterium]